MNKTIMIYLLLCVFTTVVHAQDDIIEPTLLDKSILSGVGLKKVVLKNEPEKQFYQKRLFKGKDLSVYIVSTQTWNNEFTNFFYDEFVYMFHGEAIVKPKNGYSQSMYSGDYFFAPKGYTGEWEIRAGDNLHYELSVISTQRADSSLVSENKNHQVFDPAKISGAQIQLNDQGKYSKLLRKGVELTVKLKAEKPTQELVHQQSNDLFVRLLSGQISLVDENGRQHIFYSGDFFVIPNGFRGKWESNGHGLVKYLAVEKTKN